MVSYPITSPSANQKTRVGWPTNITQAVNDHETRISAVETASVVKTADEIINNNDGLQNDNHLLKSVLPYTNYVCALAIQFEADAAADLKVDFTIPPGATLYVPTYHATISYGVAGANCSVTGIPGSGATTPLPFRAWFTLMTDNTGGTLQFRWAQNTAHASDTTVLKGSSLQVFPVT